MRIATSAASAVATPESVGRALGLLIDRLGGAPDLVLGYQTADATPAVFATLAAHLPDGRFAGCSSSRGVMTDEGLFGFSGPGFALWGVRDADGAYGTGFEAIGPGTDVEDAARRAYATALEHADRPGELPDLLWVLAVPGIEEAVIRGLDAITGGKVPITGGTAADDGLSGCWTCFGGAGLGTGVTVVALFPGSGVAASFQSGYEPAGPSGIVTRSTGRTVLEIEGRPAASVYDEWTGGQLGSAVRGGDPDILDATALCPMGREVGQITVDQRPIPYYSLVHYGRVSPSGGLVGFADVAEGERLYLMQGSIDSMVSRAGRVAEASRGLLLDTRRGHPVPQLAGGLVVYCAGCMRTVAGGLPDVVSALRAAMGGSPFVGAFTLGETGCLLGGENRHGNLMISVAVFAR